MNKPSARLAALSIGLVLAGATFAVAMAAMPNVRLRRLLPAVTELVFPGANARLQTEVKERNGWIQAELEGLGPHAWAGEYRTASPWPERLVIAPVAGYSLYEAASCGTCAGWRGAGRVLSAQDSCLTLQVELDYAADRDSDQFHLDEKLHLVRWGDLLFAVPDWLMERWCAAVANGVDFPDAPFRYLGERADFDFVDPTRPAGTPRVPAEYRRLIPDHPITGRVVSLDEWRPRPDLSPPGKPMFDAIFTLDAGSDAGLAVGMRLFVDDVVRWSRFNGRVEAVDATSARFQMNASADERGWAESLVGRRASTLRPEPPPEAR